MDEESIRIEDLSFSPCYPLSPGPVHAEYQVSPYDSEPNIFPLELPFESGPSLKRGPSPRSRPLSRRRFPDRPEQGPRLLLESPFEGNDMRGVTEGVNPWFRPGQRVGV